MSSAFPKFFPDRAKLRAWLEKNHAKKSELLVGYYKKASGRPSISWEETVKEVLCFGWIDGIRRGIDAESYSIRITPRKAGSNWSLINIRHVQALKKLGLMKPEGLKVFEARKREKSGIYSFEQAGPLQLDKISEKKLRSSKAAWAYFQSKPPSYKKAVIHWIRSAKQEETKLRRLEQLIENSQAGRKVPPLRRKGE